jgi:micrococcal nuclease
VYGRPGCFGREASAFTKQLLQPGDRVRYRLGREPRDRYQRPLIYLWLDDGRFVNELLLNGGYAVPLTIAPNDDYAARFRGSPVAPNSSVKGCGQAPPAAGTRMRQREES